MKKLIECEKRNVLMEPRMYVVHVIFFHEHFLMEFPRDIIFDQENAKEF